MNRLYWLGEDGLWRFELTNDSEQYLNSIAQSKLTDRQCDTNIGYSVIGVVTGRYWYKHYRNDVRLCRTMVNESELPKPIRLLELLHE